MKFDRAQVEKDWHSRGFSCGLWVDQPGQVWEDYVHSMDELLMVLEGELELEMQERIVKPVTLLPAAVPLPTPPQLEANRAVVQLPVSQ